MKDKYGKIISPIIDEKLELTIMRIQHE